MIEAPIRLSIEKKTIPQLDKKLISDANKDKVLASLAISSKTFYQLMNDSTVRSDTATLSKVLFELQSIGVATKLSSRKSPYIITRKGSPS